MLSSSKAAIQIGKPTTQRHLLLDIETYVSYSPQPPPPYSHPASQTAYQTCYFTKPKS